MSLLIKSDKIASSHLGNIYGISGAFDYTTILDFERGVYKTRNENGLLESIALDDAVSVTLDRESLYYTKEGHWLSAPPNTPRIHYIASANRSGILIEPFAQNLFVNSDAPATQTINASGFADNFALVVSGSGSATISGAVSGLTASGEASDGANAYGKFESGSVTVTVTGSPSRVQLLRYPAAGRAYQRTPIITGGSSVIHAGDIAEMNPTLFNNSLKSGEGTIVAQVTLLDFDSSSSDPRGAPGVMTVHDSGFSGRLSRLFISGSEAARVFNYLPASPSVSGEAGIPLKDTSARTFTVAMSYNEGLLKVSHNNQQASVDTAGMGDAVRCIFGAMLNNNPSIVTRFALNGVVNKVAFFDRELASSEFLALSNSWG